MILFEQLSWNDDGKVLGFAMSVRQDLADEYGAWFQSIRGLDADDDFVELGFETFGLEFL